MNAKQITEVALLYKDVAHGHKTRRKKEREGITNMKTVIVTTINGTALIDANTKESLSDWQHEYVLYGSLADYKAARENVRLEAEALQAALEKAIEEVCKVEARCELGRIPRSRRKHNRQTFNMK